MRGRKAANQHNCGKQDTGTWTVKSGQQIDFQKPTSKDSWNKIMSQKILLECNKCKIVKYCLLEKLNKDHFNGTEYNLPENFWEKPTDMLISSIKENLEERKARIEKTAEILANKAASFKQRAIRVSIEK